MKAFLAAIFAFAAAFCFADGLKVRSADWDSLAIPLGILPYYFELDSRFSAVEAGLQIDIYQGGKLTRTVSGARFGSSEAKPLKAKGAVYLVPDEKEGSLRLTWTMSWGTGSCDSGKGVFLSPEEFSMSKARSLAVFSAPEKDASRFTLFALVASSSGSIRTCATLEETVKANPDAQILAAYLAKGDGDKRK